MFEFISASLCIFSSVAIVITVVIGYLIFSERD